jgi:hypothetical protein
VPDLRATSAPECRDRCDQTKMIVQIVLHEKESQPDDWGLIIGDILTNLRAAVDHALFGHVADRAAAAGTPLTEAQEKALQYPLVENPTKIANAMNNLASKVDSAVLAAIDQSQPGHQSDPARQSLAVMNGLVNRDKHRTVRVVKYMSEDFRVENSHLKVLNIDTQPKEMAHGITLATITLELPPKTPRPPGRLDDNWREAPVEAVNEYVEKIEVPTGETMPLLPLIDWFVEEVEKLLDQLQKAGC